MDGSAHDSHMHYQLQKRIMGPLIAILREKMEQSTLYDPTAIKLLLNIKDHHLYIKSKSGISRYTIRGTIFSGFWGTYLFNTIIVATQCCHMTSSDFDSFRGLVSGDDSSFFLEESKVPSFLQKIDRNFLS